MRKTIAQVFLMLLIITTPAMAQTSDRKAKKEQKRVEKENEIAALVESRNFVFTASRAIPTGYKSVDLTTNSNFVKFSPTLIESWMPFFGRAYSVSYGRDEGLKFEGKPQLFTVEKKKKDYEVEVKVQSNNDTYTINLFVSFEGSSSMSISSNNRALISYNGEIMAQEKPKEEK